MLDAIDRQILTLLQQDARLTNKALAEQVGIAASTCLERVRRLQARSLFEGFHARVNPDAVGLHLQAMVAIRLSRHTRDHVDSFRNHALTFPEVRNIFYVGGRTDFLLHVAVRDTGHLRHLALTAFSSRPEVDHIETNLVFEHVMNPVLPVEAAVDAGTA